MIEEELEPKATDGHIIRCNHCNAPLLKALSGICICLRNGYIKCMSCGQRIKLKREYEE